jgi:succinyl-diaminopimelate desuccinylase
MREKLNRITKLTSDLVGIRSETKDQKKVGEALDFVSNYLKDLNLQEISFKQNDVQSRLWVMPGHDFPLKILLCGHIDVVDAEKEQYVPTIKDGIMYGRGTGDMKGHDAAMIIAMRDYVEKGGKGSVGLLLTGDEEVGGPNGARFVLEQGVSTDLVFIPDGHFDFGIVESEKAPHHFHVKATGPGGHASLAFEIDNPIEKINKLYDEMKIKYNIADKNDTWHSTFAMTTIHTGVNSENSIASEVDAWFSWRFPTEQMKFEDGVTDIEALCQKHGCRLITETLKNETDKVIEKGGHGGGEGCLTDLNDPSVVLWKEVIEEVLGRKVSGTFMHGATDGRIFYSKGSKVLITSAKTDNHHNAVEEWVDLKSLAQLSEGIEKYLELVA